MEDKRVKENVMEATEQQMLKKISGKVVAIKKQRAQNENKPRMYLKVRNLLSNVKTELAAEVIAEREK